jgi:hypothetical protein
VRFEVPDDAGFLGLLDPDAYEGFVGSDWTMQQLVARLRHQLRDRRLLLWGTGRDGMWRVRVEVEADAPRGFREVSGPIRSTRGRLLLTHWGTLTMAAAYFDVPLPEPHEEPLLLTVPPGEYRCTIVQLTDPEAADDAGEDGEPNEDFVVVLSPHGSPQAPWTEFPWSDGALG